MVRDETVCSYSNYQTFHVALFLSNNRPQYDTCLRFAKDCLTNERPALAMASALEELVQDHWLTVDARESECRTDSDYLAFALLRSSLDRVDWRQIAEEWLTTARERLDA